VPRFDTRYRSASSGRAFIRTADAVAVALIRPADVDLGREVADAGGGVVAVLDVHEADRATAGTVVACEHTQHLGAARDATSFHEGGGAEHAVAEEPGQAGAIGPYGPQALDGIAGLSTYSTASTGCAHHPSRWG